jgi:protein-tyrosine phosphatase
VDNGIHTVVATPHMLDGVYDASRESVLHGTTELDDALKEHGVPLTVLAGADVHADTEIPQLLRQGQLVTVADRGSYLMIELPSDVLPETLGELLFKIQLQSVHPIVSHPERNRAIQEDPWRVAPMVEAGALTQVTAASLVGDFGAAVYDCAHRLLEYRLAHFVATDMHDVRRRAPRLREAAEAVREAVGPDDAREILEENPGAVIHGGHVQAPEPARPSTRKKWFFW